MHLESLRKVDRRDTRTHVFPDDLWRAIRGQKLNISELLKPNHLFGQLIHSFQVKGDSGRVIRHRDECQAQQSRRMVVVKSRQEITPSIVANTVEGADLLMVQNLPHVLHHDSHTVR